LRRAIPGSNLTNRIHESQPLRYGLGVSTFLIATCVAMFAYKIGIRNLQIPFYLFAIAITAWYAGRGPAIVSVVLSILFFDYYFTEPRFTFYVTVAEIPYFAVFAAFALLVAWFSTVRRRVEVELRQARDHLQSVNEELARRSAEVEATNKELEAFAYSISHDLRAPLRHMAGYTELLQRKAAANLDEKSNRFIAMILDSAKKMGNLIDDLLAFSRIGRAETQKSQVNLTQLVKDVLNEVRPEIEGRDITWKIGDLPEVYGDRSMLRVALVNLLSNAVKFTRTRQRAEIEIGATLENGSDPVVFVKDNGVGFDMQYANKLFGVFQRLHSSDVFEGTGIGLATVQRIMHRHGGRVWAQSAPDQGATFYFSAPRSRGTEWNPSVI